MKISESEVIELEKKVETKIMQESLEKRKNKALEKLGEKINCNCCYLDKCKDDQCGKRNF